MRPVPHPRRTRGHGSPLPAACGVLWWALAPGCAGAGSDRFDPVAGSMEVVATFPGPGESLVDTRGRVDLCLSTILDPRSLSDGDLTLTSGRLSFDTLVELDLIGWHAPGSLRPLDEPWCPGSVVRIRPVSSLPAGTEVTVRMRDTLHGWDGERFDTDSFGWHTPDPSVDDGDVPPEDFPEESTDPVFRLHFRVDPAATTTDDPAPTSLVALFAEGNLFDPTRAACSCHADADHPARALLDLRSPEHAHASVFSRPLAASEPFPLVAPGRPDRSALLHRLVRDPETGTLLRGVAGDPMPLDEPPLGPTDLAAVHRWIADGARP